MYISLTNEQKTVCEKWAASNNEDLSKRAKVVLAYAEGVATLQVSELTGMSSGRCRHWKRQFQARGIGIFPAEAPASKKAATKPAAKARAAAKPAAVKKSPAKPAAKPSPAAKAKPAAEKPAVKKVAEVKTEKATAAPAKASEVTPVEIIDAPAPEPTGKSTKDSEKSASAKSKKGSKKSKGKKGKKSKSGKKSGGKKKKKK